MTIEIHSYTHYWVLTIPHLSCFLLYKCRTGEVIFTQRCFHDVVIKTYWRNCRQGILYCGRRHPFASNWHLPYLKMAEEMISWPTSTKECCWTRESNCDQADAHLTELPGPVSNLLDGWVFSWFNSGLQKFWNPNRSARSMTSSTS